MISHAGVTGGSSGLTACCLHGTFPLQQAVQALPVHVGSLTLVTDNFPQTLASSSFAKFTDLQQLAVQHSSLDGGHQFVFDSTLPSLRHVDLTPIYSRVGTANPFALQALSRSLPSVQHMTIAAFLEDGLAQHVLNLPQLSWLELTLLKRSPSSSDDEDSIALSMEQWHLGKGTQIKTMTMTVASAMKARRPAPNMIITFLFHLTAACRISRLLR